jgi:methyl-accepting chemotaxis protein
MTQIKTSLFSPGLTAKLVMLLVVFASFPMAIVAIIGFTAARGMEEGVAKRFQVTAETISDKIDRNLFERYGDVQAFTTNRIVLERYNWYTPGEKDNEISRAMNDYVKTYGIYFLTIFVDTQGDVIAVNSRDAQGTLLETRNLYNKNYKDSLWFQALSSEHYTTSMPFTTPGNDISTGTFIEDVHIDKDVLNVFPGNDGLTIGFSAPVYQDGDLIGYWSNRANFSLVEEIFQQTYQGLKQAGFPSAELTLLDGEGRVIVDYDPTLHGTDSVRHDFQHVLLKLNLVDKGVSVAKEAVRGKSGHRNAFHFRKQIWQASGYAHLQGALGYPGMNWSVLVRVPTGEAAAEAYTIQRELVFATLLCLLAVIPLGVVIGRMVIGRLKPIIQVATIAAQGDLTQRVSNKSHDELGDMGRSLNHFLEDLNEMLSQTGHIARSVAVAAEELSANGKQVTEASGHQSSQSTQTAAAVEEMSARAKEMAGNAQILAGKARDLSHVARQGGAAVNNSVQGMEIVSRTIQTSANQIQGLGQRSQEIGEIIRVIEDIADQTNLLALNAAIEAARAGEQGRGFAVVADEVRKLAERTGKATKEIAEVIKTVQEGTREAVSSMDSGTTQVQEGMSLVHEAGVRLEEMVQGVENVTEMVGHIATSIDQQTLVTEEMAEGVQRVASLSQENENHVGGVASATADLSKMAAKLQEYLSSFKVKT